MFVVFCVFVCSCVGFILEFVFGFVVFVVVLWVLFCGFVRLWKAVSVFSSVV